MMSIIHMEIFGVDKDMGEDIRNTRQRMNFSIDKESNYNYGF